MLLSMKYSRTMMPIPLNRTLFLYLFSLSIPRICPTRPISIFMPDTFVRGKLCIIKDRYVAISVYQYCVVTLISFLSERRCFCQSPGSLISKEKYCKIYRKAWKMFTLALPDLRSNLLSVRIGIFRGAAGTNGTQKKEAEILAWK